MTHDNTSAVMEKFKGLGATKVNDPSQLYVMHSTVALLDLRTD
jgi:hypothetical protein